ncbi:MAG: NADPH dehydrogenase NamA [Flavobacteriaceae bacterium]|jgi:2,4-dienoyl-CoA reductase-like NADH-dependent reductase (Old Yellow Enzyme family)|nr:NADPH dehydrogenase NamA [Flavobacteriaceae bacterium]
MSRLFQKLKLKNLTLKNRIVMPPICQYSAHEGFANDWHFVHYGSRSIGQTALLIQEATAVALNGRITDRDLGIWHDEQILKLAQITDFAHKHGALFGIQLAHAGRKATVKGSVAPSALRFDETYQIPKELSRDEIKIIVDEFRDAAIRSIKSNYDVLEIHAAHGYLIHEFLSPLTNRRTDEYGGSFENRIRFLIEIVEAINRVITDRVSLWVRISATDWAETGGWDLEQSVELMQRLKNLNVEVADVSTGGLIPEVKIPIAPNYQVPFAKKIKQETGIITGAVGLITNAVQAEEILQNNEADFVLVGRELLRNPYFPMEAANILREDIAWAEQYNPAKFKN